MGAAEARIFLYRFRQRSSVLMPKGAIMNINSLDRFTAAQEKSYERALAEIGRGEKRTHWMWYRSNPLDTLRPLRRASSFARMHGNFSPKNCQT